MRKPILFSALFALFLCPTLASYAGSTMGNSEQQIQGGSEASASASVSNNRLIEDLPPLAKDATVPNTTGNGNGTDTGTVKPVVRKAVEVSNTASDVHAKVDTYVWTK